MTLPLLQPRIRHVLAVLSGALAPLTLSPLDLWFLALPSVAVLYLLLQGTTPRQAAVAGWYYGFGFFGVGASWVYVSINVYGNASPLLAGLLTLGFVAGLAWFFVLQCWFYRKFACAVMPLLGFGVCWVLGEWFRSWFLTGFPWLYLGYAHVTTLFSGLAPIFGVMGISFMLALSGGLLGECWLSYRREGSLMQLGRSRYPLALLLMWVISSATTNIHWVEPLPDRTLSVGLVQPDIAQQLKFDPSALQDSLDTHAELSAPLWGNDLVLWPETAVPMTYQQAGANGLLASLEQVATQSGSTLVTGLFFNDGDRIYNSLAAIGHDSGGLWHKRKLVPFGEYVPLRDVLAGLLQIFELPMSSLAPGPREQDGLTVAGLHAAAFICYEVVYPEFVREQAAEADFLLTVSNDTWFGASWGPLQHLQMAAMRARENGRYMVRATNNGVSALIDERGNVLARTEQFVAATLSGSVRLFSGRTPWSRWGNWPLLGLSFLVLAANLYRVRASARTVSP